METKWETKDSSKNNGVHSYILIILNQNKNNIRKKNNLEKIH